jgi:hypothetical protein
MNKDYFYLPFFLLIILWAPPRVTGTQVTNIHTQKDLKFHLWPAFSREAMRKIP